MKEQEIEKNSDDIYALISRNVKKYRTLSKMTQASLAERVDLSHEFIRRIESKKGKKGVSVDTVYRISRALNIEIKKLFEEEN